MIKNLQSYLFSLDDSFEKLIADINYYEKRIRPKHGLRIIEPSRIEIALSINQMSEAEKTFNTLQGSAFDNFIHNNNNAKKSVKAITYDTSKVANQLKQYIWTKNNVVADGIFATLTCLQLGLLLPSLIELRSTLEQISNLILVEKESLLLFENNSIMDDAQLIAELSSVIHKNTLATRIDWEHYASNPVRGGKKKSYKSPEEFESIQADSILNSIDYLDKQIKGTRRAYEFLCEFAHPNAGAYLVFRSIKREVKRNSPFTFIETILSNETPSSSIDWLKSPIIECYSILHDSLELFVSSSNNLNKIYKQTNKKSNNLIKQALKNWEPIWQTSEPCPCLSGNDLSSCCGKTLKKKHRIH